MTRLRFLILAFLWLLSVKGFCQDVVDKKLDSLINLINNENIFYSTERTGRSILLERKVTIDSPYAAVAIVKIGPIVTKYLVEKFPDEDKDWAIHLLLASIHGYEPSLIHFYKDISHWRKVSKDADIEYWNKYISN